MESRAVDQAARAEVPLTQPAEKPSYCRHSPSERGALGRYGQDGSEICIGCRLPYAPGSPGPGLRPAVGRSGPFTRPGEKPSDGLFKVWVAIAALALVAGLVWFSLGSRGQEQQSGPVASSSGPAATDMGCTDAWTLVKSSNGIKIYDCSAVSASGHQTLWRFDDAGSKAVFMGVMSRAIRPNGHLVVGDLWAVISDSSASLRAAINAGGQDYDG